MSYNDGKEKNSINVHATADDMSTITKNDAIKMDGHSLKDVDSSIKDTGLDLDEGELGRILSISYLLLQEQSSTMSAVFDFNKSTSNSCFLFNFNVILFGTYFFFRL